MDKPSTQNREQKKTKDRARLAAYRHLAKNHLVSVLLWLTPRQRDELRGVIVAKGWAAHSARAALESLGVVNQMPARKVVEPKPTSPLHRPENIPAASDDMSLSCQEEPSAGQAAFDFGAAS